MWYIQQQILAAATEHEIIVSPLEAWQVVEIRQSLLHLYSPLLDEWPKWIWEHLQFTSTVRDENGWRWLGEFAGEHAAIMLFDPRDEVGMVEFSRGIDIARVLGECSGFEFYLTSRNYDYLLCFNHHDCVIAAGSAKTWLELRG